jgi:predicted DNA-binding transcriptional regulator YafY
MSAPKWKRQQWTVARAAAVLAAAVKPKGGKTPSLEQIEARFGLGLRELLFLARRLGLQEDLGVTAQDALSLDLDYRADGRLGLRSQGAEALTHLTLLGQAEARLAAQALRSLALPPADQALCASLAEHLEQAAGAPDEAEGGALYFRPTDPPAVRRKVSLLAEALQQGKTVAFEYRGPASKSAGRVADPISLRRDAGAWRLLAFDQQRQALRVFALDHLAKPVITVGDSRYPKRLDLKALRARDLSVYQPNGQEVAVTLRLTAGLARELKPLFSGAPKADPAAGWVRVTLKSASPQWVVRTFLPHVPQVQVLGPESFKQVWDRDLAALKKAYATD